jgi:hypothetical protein
MAHEQVWRWHPSSNVRIEVVHHAGASPWVAIANAILEDPEAELAAIQQAVIEAGEVYRARRQMVETED